MNVALIYTDEDIQAFGMRSISSVLKKAGHHTKLILMKSRGTNYSQQALEETRNFVSDSDVIGISCFSRASGKAIQVVEAIRPLGKMCVWGGVHATLNPNACAKYVDVVCRGEGEGFMLELLVKIEKGGNWKDIANAVYKENGRIVMNGLRPLISNLDELPVLDFSHDDEFHLKGDRFIQIHKISDATRPIAFNGTRGCEFHCAYCSNAKLKALYSGNGHYARKLSIEKLIEHSVSLKQSFPKAKFFNFFDEDFSARKGSEIRRFSEAYSEQIGIPFESMVSPLRINEEKMDLLVNAGLWRINMGVESGSERTKREIYNRYMSNKAVMRAARIINKYPHVVAYYFFIIGNPYEEQDDLIATVQHIRDLPTPYYLRVYNLIFIPGTFFYESAIKDGIIRGVQDSGFELDFLGGFNYKKHPWKRKNLYLNGLIHLMSGKITRLRLGLVPRQWIGFLLHPKVVAFNEKNTILIRSLIYFKMLILKLRASGASFLKKLLNDPTSIYHLKSFIKSKLIK